MLAILLTVFISTLIVSAQAEPIPIVVEENRNQILDRYGVPDESPMKHSPIVWEWNKSSPIKYYQTTIRFDRSEKVLTILPPEKDEVELLAIQWVAHFWEMDNQDKLRQVKWAGEDNRILDWAYPSMVQVKDLVSKKLLDKKPNYIYTAQKSQKMYSKDKYQHLILIWRLEGNDYVALLVFRQMDQYWEREKLNKQTGRLEKTYELKVTLESLYYSRVLLYWQGHAKNPMYIAGKVTSLPTVHPIEF